MNSSKSRFKSRAISVGLAGALAVLFASSCTSSAPTASCSTQGAAVVGPSDSHCVMNGTPIVQSVNPASCSLTEAGASAGDDAGASDGAAGSDDAAAAGDDAGAVDAGDIGNCGDPAYGATMYGYNGSDDDCKYDIQWTSTALCQGQSVFFTVTVMHRSAGGAPTPVTGANPRPDVVLNCNHPIPNTPKPASSSPETSPGTYTVGPIAFDKPGKWVVRFHFFEDCVDQPDSPHGHVAFYVQIP